MQAQVCLSADTIQERVTINSVSFDYTVAKTTGGIVVFTKSWFLLNIIPKILEKLINIFTVLHSQHLLQATKPITTVLDKHVQQTSE